MKVAVIGAGLFGISTALELDRAGHEVTLFEKYADILQAASGINQYRLHRGYHYPRSDETIKACVSGEDSFREWYGDALMSGTKHYYAIAKEGSKTSADEFRKICGQFDLVHTKEDSGLTDHGNIEMSFLVDECLIDPKRLYDVCKGLLGKSKVILRTSTEVKADNLGDFEHIIVATYASINSSLGDKTIGTTYQFEVCEKLVIQLPEQFKNKSLVIIDGPFMCIDPFGNTGMHVMGNVNHAIHSTNIGREPKIPANILPLLNRGVIKNPSVTNFKHFIESAVKFMPAIRSAQHVGSMYTVRTVIPNIDATDARPTLVQRIDDRTITIFSGKLVNCVEAARQVRNLLNR